MTTIVELQKEPGHFGGCPNCGRDDGYLNVGRCHWFICHRHKRNRCIGSNLFSDWRYEDEREWTRNEYLLAGYAEVSPATPCEPGGTA